MSEVSVYAKKFFDLQKELTTNIDFQNRIIRKLHDIELAEKSSDRELWKEEIMELLRMCDYNPSLLVPMFFPKFYRGKSMTLHTRPHAIAMMAMGANLTMTIQASRQVGKCLTGKSAIEVQDVKTSTSSKCTLEDLFEEAKAATAAHSAN